MRSVIKELSGLLARHPTKEVLPNRSIDFFLQMGLLHEIWP